MVASNILGDALTETAVKEFHSTLLFFFGQSVPLIYS